MSTSPAATTVQWFVQRNSMVLLLAVAGGGVDAIVISHFQVLVGAQTGNTVLLAVALAQGHFAAGFYSGVSVASFIIGSIASELVMINRKPTSPLSSISRALVAELIALSALLASWHFYSGPDLKMTSCLIALAAASMGIQSAAVMSFRGSPTTTYVTGTLGKFSTDLTIWIIDRASGAHSTKLQPQATPVGLLSRSGKVLYGLDWLVYLGGGVAGALLYTWVRELALAFPIVAIAFAILAAPGRTQDNSE